jgi:hypothetical protein
MTGEFGEELPLGPDERIVKSWPGQATKPGESTWRRGRLILTDRRCLIFLREGLFNRERLANKPIFVVSLERLDSLGPRQFFLRIGYGDKMEIGGIELNGQEFQLGRESAPLEVVSDIAKARTARLKDLSGPRVNEAVPTHTVDEPLK